MGSTNMLPAAEKLADDAVILARHLPQREFRQSMIVLVRAALEAAEDGALAEWMEDSQ